MRQYLKKNKPKWILSRKMLGLCAYCANASNGKYLCRSCADRKRENENKRRDVVLSLERQSSKRSNIRARTEIISAYGGCCQCCSESTREFLTVDHIDLNDFSLKYPKAPRAGKDLYKWLRANAYPDGIRLLCFNCNMARAFFGECPHVSQGVTRKPKATDHIDEDYYYKVILS